MVKTKLPERDFTWTPSLAYAIGLLVTDGCLSKDGRHIIMRSSDTEQLETFRRCLGIQNKIAESHNNGYATKPSYRVQFGNIQFYNWLLTIGLFPAKTYTIGKIKIPDDYFVDFLRGHLDDTVRRGNEIRIQLPEKMDLIHSIKTDDPSGIEAYWHRRFESKRMKGEWFALNSADIKAFKRWRHIH